MPSSRLNLSGAIAAACRGYFYYPRPTVFAHARRIAAAITIMMMAAQAWPIVAPDVLRRPLPQCGQGGVPDPILFPHTLHLTKGMRDPT